MTAWPLIWSLPALVLFGVNLVQSQTASLTSNQFGTLSGKVIDAQTGRASPCTVIIVDSKNRTVIERESFTGGFRCDGEFTKRLPPGPTRVRVVRGFETRAVERALEVPAGGHVEIVIQLERFVDLRRRGWYGGDSHVHMVHGENTLPVDFDYVALTARAEDLRYMCLAQSWTLENPTPEKLDAELRRRSVRDCLLSWNLEAPKNYYRGDAGRCLGHCWMLGVSGRTPNGDNVIDALLQASAHDYQSEKPAYANFESHALIHSQGGAVFYTHPARWWMGAWGGKGGYQRQERMRVSNLAVELPLDTLLGPTFDGVDLITGPGEFEANAMAFELWCLLLNHGYRVAGTASSDACFDRAGGAIPGVVRTYAYASKNFSLPKVTRAIAHGATFVTSGPLLLAALDGQPPGGSFPANGKSHNLRIEAWASGTDSNGLSRVELVRNGQLAQAIPLSANASFFTTNLTISEVATAWYCVRAFGSDPQRQRAISGAFFLDGLDYRPPAPVPARIRIKLQDALTGRKLSGFVSEFSFLATRPLSRKKHSVATSEAVITAPGTVRLVAEVPGYNSQTLSPFLDNPELLNLIVGLSAEDLLKWETYEHVRSLLAETTLTFKLKKPQQAP
jgi:hypothetical protein